MKHTIKVYGSGCVKCKTLEKRVHKVLAELDLQFDVQKVTDIIEIMEAGVSSTPALEIDGKMVIKGRVATEKEIRANLEAYLS
ncbi:MAG: thioredoxin family protein [Candidatus Hodarchaeota archaeon]